MNRRGAPPDWAKPHVYGMRLGMVLAAVWVLFQGVMWIIEQL